MIEREKVSQIYFKFLINKPRVRFPSNADKKPYLLSFLRVYFLLFFVQLFAKLNNNNIRGLI